MAQKTLVQLIDDLDGNTADETVEFGLDGSSYAIDLSDKHAGELRETLAPYVAAARRASGRRGSGSGGGRGRSSSSASSSADRERLQEIRQWGKDNGFQVSERGRLSRALVEAYEAAH